MRLGRRGEESEVLDFVIQLVFFVLFAVSTIVYVNSHANSDAYFSRYHASDLASASDIILSRPGDTLIHYENFRNPLDYAFSNGVVAIKPQDSDVWTKRLFDTAEEFEPQSASAPTALLLQKVGDTYRIGEDISPIACEVTKTPLDAIALSFEGTFTDRDKELIRENFVQTSHLPLRDDGYPLVLELQSGPNALHIQDDKGLGCLFPDTLKQVNLIQFAVTTSESSDTRIVISVDSHSQLTPQQIGIALASAVSELNG